MIMVISLHFMTFLNHFKVGITDAIGLPNDAVCILQYYDTFNYSLSDIIRNVFFSSNSLNYSLTKT